MNEPDQLHIRPARSADRDAVFEMVKTVWGGNDYVPEVWDEWLSDTSGPLLAGELDGRVVALTKLSALGPGEDWFHGTRVDPAYRGRGIAKLLLRHCVGLSREQRAHKLRFLTDEDNAAMHRVAETEGFRLAYAPGWYTVRPLRGETSAAPLPPERLAALLRDRKHSPLLKRTGGMYSYHWRNLDLSEARLREHLARGEIVGLPADDAWAIVVRHDEDDNAWLAHVEGAGEELERLCAALAIAPDERPLRALLPADAPGVPALLAAGFTGPEDPMRVYELRLRTDQRRMTNDE